MIEDFEIGDMEEKDVESLIPILRQWIQRDGLVIEEEFRSVLGRIVENTKRNNEDVFLVVRDGKGKAVGVMGFGAVNEKMAQYKSSPESHAAGLVTAFMSRDHRSAGLGKSLMTELFDRAAATGRTEMIWTSNARYKETAWKFYTDMSGEPVGMIDGFFEAGMKTPVWRKSL